jgi:thymidylate synthase (FAD)
MKVIQPSFYLCHPFNKASLTRLDGAKMLKHIEQMARISHRSEDRATDDSWGKFLEAVVIKHGDWSVTEHASVTAVIRTDRGITHELVRHRLFAFTQESTRFVRYHRDGAAGEMEFIQPTRINESAKSINLWEKSVKESELTYSLLLEDGGRPQEARSVLPNSLAATIAVTGNLRNWRHFFLMRTSRETHPDFKRISVPMLQEFKNVVPLLYDDIQPEQRQVDNLGKPR